MDLNVADRIEVSFRCDAELRGAVEAHADYIAGETLAKAFAFGTPGDDAFTVKVGERAFEFSIVLAGA